MDPNFPSPTRQRQAELAATQAIERLLRDASSSREAVLEQVAQHAQVLFLPFRVGLRIALGVGPIEAMGDELGAAFGSDASAGCIVLRYLNTGEQPTPPWRAVHQQHLDNLAERLSTYLRDDERLHQVKLREEQLSHVLTATNEAIWDCDLVAGWVRHNRRWCEMLGFSDEMLEHQVSFYFERIHPDDQAQVNLKVQEALSHTSRYAADYRLRHADGHYIWVRDHGMVADRAADGRPLRIIGAFSDITAQITAEQALRQSEDRLSVAQAGANVGVWERDLLTNVSYFSPECERLHGFPPGTLKTHDDWLKRVADEDLHKIDDGWNDKVLHGLPFEIEYRTTLPSGATRWMLSRGHAHYDDAGQPVRLFGVVLDITERKRLENELRLQTDVLLNMTEGVSLVDEQGRLVFTTPRFDAMFGYGPGELIGRDVSVCNAPSTTSPQEQARIILGALDRQGFWQGEILNIRKDGSTFLTFASIRSFFHQTFGNVWLGVLRDISESQLLRHERDQAYRELATLSAHIQDQAEDLRRDLAREVHDEIGALLTGIHMRVEAARSQSPDSQARQVLDNIKELTHKAVAATRRLCSSLRPPMLDDLGLIESCRWYLEDWSRTAGIPVNFTLDLPDDQLSDRLTTDIFRVMQELMTNVARHAAASGVTVTLKADRRQLTLCVCDNGKGMGKAGDTGFGLRGIRERARRHGGQLTLSSDSNGTTACLILPRN